VVFTGIFGLGKYWFLEFPLANTEFELKFLRSLAGSSLSV